MKLSATTGLVAAACAIAISSPAAADGNGGISPYGYGNIYGNIFGTTDSAARKPAPEPPSGGRAAETKGDAPSQPRSVQLLQRQQQQYLAWKTQSWDGKPISYTPAKWTTEKERADHCTSYAGEESCEPGYESYPSADEMARNATVDRVVDGALTLGLSEGVRALPVSEDIKPLLNTFAGFIGPEALVRTGVKLAPQIDRFLRTSEEVRAYEQAGGDVRALRQTLDEVGAKYDEASAASATGTGSAPVAVFDTYSADQVPAKLAEFAQKTAADPQHPRTPFRNEVSGRPLLPDATASGKPITYDYVEAANGNTLVRGDDGSSYALTSDGSGQLSIHELPAAAGKAPESTTTDSATQTQTPRTAASGTQESAPQPSTPRADAPDGAAGVATQDQSVQTDPAAGGLKGGGTGEPPAGQNPADPQPSTSKRPAPDDDSVPDPKRGAVDPWDADVTSPPTAGEHNLAKYVYRGDTLDLEQLTRNSSRTGKAFPSEYEKSQLAGKDAAPNLDIDWHQSGRRLAGTKDAFVSTSSDLEWAKHYANEHGNKLYKDTEALYPEAAAHTKSYVYKIRTSDDMTDINATRGAGSEFANESEVASRNGIKLNQIKELRELREDGTLGPVIANPHYDEAAYANQGARRNPELSGTVSRPGQVPHPPVRGEDSSTDYSSDEGSSSPGSPAASPGTPAGASQPSSPEGSPLPPTPEGSPAISTPADSTPPSTPEGPTTPSTPDESSSPSTPESAPSHSSDPDYVPSSSDSEGGSTSSSQE